MRQRKAFTLVELLVVIAIIGILFVVLISKVDFATDKAKTAGAQTDLRSYELAAYTIGVEQQGFTSDLELLAEQLNKNLDPKLRLNVDGEHITTEAKDPWGKEYRIAYNEPDSSRGQIIITSAGVDTKYDTEDDINIIITYTVDEDGGHVEIEMSNGVVNPAPDTPTEPSDPTDPDTPTEPEQGGEQEPVRLAAGLYDAEDNLVASWDELVNTYGMDIENNNSNFAPRFVVPADDVLKNGVKMVIPDSVMKIGSYAFFNCTWLQSIEIGNGVTNIEQYAFSGCSGLTDELFIPDSVTIIKSRAFQNCSNVTSVDIGSGITCINDVAFYNCSGLTGVYIKDLTAWCQINFESAWSNPLYYAKNLYLNNEPITNLVIPDEITEIKKYAFYNAQNITGTLTIHDSVASVGNSAFRDCSGLASVALGSSVASIGENAFYRCSGLTGRLNIPNSLSSVGDGAFDYCTNLTSMNINDLALWCEIDFKDYDSNPLYYAKNLYLNNEPITNLVIPNEITEIKQYAFAGAKNIQTLTIHNDVISIGKGAFYCCSDLIDVKMGCGVENIDDLVFFSCSLKGVYITDLSSWCNIMFKSNDIFNYNTNLYLNNELITDLIIPEDVTKVKEYAFHGSNIVTLTIPDNVTSIGSYSFLGCRELTSVTIESSILISYTTSMFKTCTALTAIYVPADLVDQYKAAAGWIDFADKIQAIPTT